MNQGKTINVGSRENRAPGLVKDVVTTTLENIRKSEIQELKHLQTDT